MNLAVMFDTWHFCRTGGTLRSLEGLAPGEVGGVQASDAPTAQHGVIGVAANSRLLPGEGAIPVGEVIDRVLIGNPDAFIAVEVISGALDQLPIGEAAARARASMRKVMT